jgi:twinkle protein
LTEISKFVQPGTYFLRDLPQGGSVEKISVSSGWEELDEIWKCYPGQFTIISGIAGSGKSTFCQNLVMRYAQIHRMVSWLYVPENELHIRKKFSLLWGNDVAWEDFISKRCLVQSSMPEYYDDEPKTLPWVLDQAVWAIQNHSVDLVIIDPWNELERAKAPNQLLTDYIAECLMYLKQFCRSMDTACVLVAHPTKAGIAEGKIPGLADIEGSLAWYNKCDNGLIVHRESDDSATRIISAKAREIGSGRKGTVYFRVDRESGRFEVQYGAVQI